MAEFCLDCWNKLNGTNYSESKFIMSKGLEFCEECEELKSIVIVERWSFYRYKLRFLIIPFVIIVRIVVILLRLLAMPFLKLKSKVLKK